MKNIRIQTYTGEALHQYIDDLAALRIEIFKSYPYLYDGSLAYEKEYIKRYADSKKSAIVIAFDGGEVIGASTCIPMVEEGEGVKKPFVRSALPVEKILYLGESVLKAQYRGQGIGVSFFEHREIHARQLQMQYTAFCAVVRPEDHPLKPAGYKPLDRFWKNRGYQIHPDKKATMTWKDIDQPQETAKDLVFWVKKLDDFEMTT